LGVSVDHIRGQTFHGRKGAVANAFRYGIDYVLCPMEGPVAAPRLFARNRANLMTLHDRDHGGARRRGRGAAWVREVVAAHGLERWCDGRIDLLAQPRVMGLVFNPVAFWLVHDAAGLLRLVIAEVNNTMGERHSYLCHHDDMAAIDGSRRLAARKSFHVSPFQPVTGAYTFRFEIGAARVNIRIDYDDGKGGGLIATFSGRRAPLGNGAILRECLARPAGALRVLGLIHWQAVKLWWKGAPFRRLPPPPEDEVSR
jgi:DUF1365 family protein